MDNKKTALSDKILKSVQKPTRYIGNEWNSVHKNPQEVDIRFAFCFPDVYEVGMSHLGLKILYHLLNERKDTYCERVFAPWTDMEDRMRENNIPLFALESGDTVSGFDFLGFTLQYEMSYTNILNMLDLAGLPLESSDRTEGMPFVCAGGPCAYNPEPVADFFDFFMLGEGEEIINEVMDAYHVWKQRAGATRKEFLESVAAIPGVYVPSLYDVQYQEDGTIKSITPVDSRFPAIIRKRIMADFENAYFPDKIIVPFMDVVHDRIMLELFRGCIRGCRFCQAGYVYRPVRERKPGTLIGQAEKLQVCSGYEEISLTSLSTSDYTGLSELADGIIEGMSDKMVSLSLPSLRVDSFSLELMEKVQKIRKSGLTFAPEAGTQRLRDVINKGISEQDIINSTTLAFGGGWSTVKLYFMMGLPTETMDDLAGIADLGEKICAVYRQTPPEKRGKGLTVNISVACFVPKPFTPFQWEPQDDMATFKEKQYFIKQRIRNRSISYSYHDSKTSFLEAVFARGDRRTGKVLLAAFKRGCKFDAWGEHFKYDQWMAAFEDAGVDAAFYANRARSLTEVLPWDHIDIGVSKTFLINEREKAYRGETTANCRADCAGCGAATFGGGICVE